MRFEHGDSLRPRLRRDPAALLLGLHQPESVRPVGHAGQHLAELRQRDVHGVEVSLRREEVVGGDLLGVPPVGGLPLVGEVGNVAGGGPRVREGDHLGGRLVLRFGGFRDERSVGCDFERFAGLVVEDLHYEEFPTVGRPPLAGLRPRAVLRVIVGPAVPAPVLVHDDHGRELRREDRPHRVPAERGQFVGGEHDAGSVGVAHVAERR